MQNPNKFTDTDEMVDEIVDPEEMVDPEEQLSPSALAEVMSMARADQDGIQDAEAHELADRVMDMTRLEHEERVAAEQPSHASGRYLAHLQWMQRQSVRLLHSSFALQREREEFFAARGSVPDAYSNGPSSHRRRHRGSRGAAA